MKITVKQMLLQLAIEESTSTDIRKSMDKVKALYNLSCCTNGTYSDEDDRQLLLRLMYESWDRYWAFRNANNSEPLT